MNHDQNSSDDGTTGSGIHLRFIGPSRICRRGRIQLRRPRWLQQRGNSTADETRERAMSESARSDRRAQRLPRWTARHRAASISARGEQEEGEARDGRESRETRLNADVFSRRRLAVFDRTTGDRRDWARPQVADLQDARGRNGKLPRASKSGRERLLNRSS